MLLEAGVYMVVSSLYFPHDSSTLIHLITSGNKPLPKNLK